MHTSRKRQRVARYAAMQIAAGRGDSMLEATVVIARACGVPHWLLGLVPIPSRHELRQRIHAEPFNRRAAMNSYRPPTAEPFNLED